MKTFGIISAGRAVLKLMGHRPFLHSRLCHPLSRLMPSEPQTVPMQGYSLRLDLRHPGDLSRAWGAWEPHLYRFFRRTIRPGMKFVDVGAHHGTYTALAASIVGYRGHVYSFEPFPDNLELLHATIADNCFKNVTIFPYAATDKAGLEGLSIVGPHLVLNGGLEVSGCRIDEVLFSQPDIVKIDTDGSEWRVLDGMSKFLDAGVTLVVEVSGFAYQPLGETMGKVLSRLGPLGYESRIILPDGSTSPFDVSAFNGNEAHLVFERS